LYLKLNWDRESLFTCSNSRTQPVMLGYHLASYLMLLLQSTGYHIDVSKVTNSKLHDGFKLN